MIRYVLAALYALTLQSVTSHAQTNAASAQTLLAKCDVELFKHRETSRTRQTSLVYFLDLVTDSNYEEMKRQYKSSWDGPYGFFDSEFSQFDVKRREFRKEVQYLGDNRYSRDHAVSTLSPIGLEAYKACLLKESPARSVTLYLDPNTSFDSLVTFEVNVKTDTDLRGHILSLDVFGGQIATAVVLRLARLPGTCRVDWQVTGKLRQTREVFVSD